MCTAPTKGEIMNKEFIRIMRIFTYLILAMLLACIVIWLVEGRPVRAYSEPEIKPQVRYLIVEKEIVKEVEVSEIAWDMFTVTAYTQFDDGCNNITAIGVNLDKSWTKYFNFCAVDPTVIPYGKTVYIKDGQEIIEALSVDTGGAIKGKHIDLYVKSLDEAYDWGVRQLEVGVVN